MHRAVARKVHPSLLGVGKNYAWATKCPHAYCAETPVKHGLTQARAGYVLYRALIIIGNGYIIKLHT